MLCPSSFLKPYSTADECITAEPAFQEICQCCLQAMFKTGNNPCRLSSTALPSLLQVAFSVIGSIHLCKINLS